MPVIYIQTSKEVRKGIESLLSEEGKLTTFPSDTELAGFVHGLSPEDQKRLFALLFAFDLRFQLPSSK